MKCIWIIKQYGSIPDIPGGSRQYDFARGLADKGYRVAYFLPSFSHILRSELIHFDHPLYCIEKRDGFWLVWIKAFSYYSNNWRRALNAFDFAWRIRRISRILCNGDLEFSHPDKILCFNLPLLAPIVSSFVAKKIGAQFYLEIGDLWPQTLIDMGILGEKNPITWCMRRAEHFLYRKAAGIVTPLPNASDYVQHCVSGSKTTFIGSGVDLSDFCPTESCGSSSCENEDFTILYTGAHGPANDLLPVIKAFKRVHEFGHSQVKFVLVGDGVQKLFLIEYVRKNRIKNVFFKNPVPKREIPAILMRSDACLFRLKSIGVFKYGINPNKLNDYLCAGKPILFFADGSNNVVEGIGCGLTVPIDDPDQMAHAIIQLSTMDASDRREMGTKARDYATQNLSIERLIERIEIALDLNKRIHHE